MLESSLLLALSLLAQVAEPVAPVAVPVATDAISAILNALLSGGPLGFAALCLLAVFWLAKHYVSARDAKDTVLLQWNTESKTLLIEATESSLKTAEALAALLAPLTAVQKQLEAAVDKNAQIANKIDARQARIIDRLARIEDQLNIKRSASDDNHDE